MAITLTLAGPEIDVVESCQDDKAVTIIDDYLTAYGVDIEGQTDQEKAEALMPLLVRHLEETGGTVSLRSALDAATEQHAPSKWEA